MRDNHFITILGKSDYVRCNYDEFKDCKFIQEALIKKYKDQLDRISVFATEGAIDENWEQFENIIRGIKERNNGKFNFNKKESLNQIPKGFTEEEIWEIFNKILSTIRNEENIFLDITHGFRYQPMLVVNILNYAKVTKNIEVKTVNYGLFEKLGHPKEVEENIPLEERDAEILDLTVFDYLNDWVVGVDNFSASGDAEKLSDITEKEKGKKFKENEKEETKNLFKEMSYLGQALHAFNQELKTARGNSLNSKIQDVLNALDNIEEIEESTNKIAPFINLIDNIKDKFKCFKRGENEETMLENYFILLDWCREHDLVQQGFIVFRENIISFIADELGFPFLPEHMASQKHEFKLKEYRGEISSVLYKKSEYVKNNFDDNSSFSNEDNHSIVDGDYNPKMNRKMAKKVEIFLENNFSYDFFIKYLQLRVKRNDVCHFGLTEESSSDSGNIIKTFDDCVDEFKNLPFWGKNIQ